LKTRIVFTKNNASTYLFKRKDAKDSERKSTL
jgi:hypothetical protein